MLSIIALLVAERLRDTYRSKRGQVVPVEALVPEPTRVVPEARADAGSTPASASWQLSDFYHGPARITGVVQTGDGSPVAGAEVVCRPVGFDPMHAEEFAEITTHTDPTGFFSLANQPDTLRYTVSAFTRSHYGTLDVASADATTGDMVITVAPVYYTRHVFVDSDGQPVVQLPSEVRQLIWGCVLGSSHAAWPPDPTNTWILSRMGVRLTDESNIAVSVFVPPVGPARPSTMKLALPGYVPVSVSMVPHALSEWPKGETVRLVPDDGDSRVRYDVEIPAALAWPAEWGMRSPSLDFRIWYTVDGRGYASVSRRVFSFALPPDSSFTLKDQNDRVLVYSLVDRGDRKLVRPQYPGYGLLRVTFVPTADLSKPYGVTLLPRGETDRTVIVGSAPVPGVCFFGPLAVGDYEAQLQWFVAGSHSAFVPIRDLGVVTVREGANDYRCE